MKYGYFPGCSLTSTAKEYDRTVRELALSLGVELVELEDWNCCGATPAAAVSEEVSLALPWCNLAVAEQMGLDAVLSPCPACHSHLCASHEVAQDADLAERMQQLTESSYSGNVRLVHLLDFLHDVIGPATITEKVRKPLLGLKAVCYYGCLTRLHGTQVDDKEQPQKMDRLVEALGGKALPFSHATDCCGASLVLSKTDTVLRLSNEILHAAKVAGANCIVVTCSVCQGNLDMRQQSIEKKFSVEYGLPVLYLSQIVMLALGMGYKELGFRKHFIRPEKLFETVFVEPPKPTKQKKTSATKAS